jgi:hypothetical protein
MDIGIAPGLARTDAGAAPRLRIDRRIDLIKQQSGSIVTVFDDILHSSQKTRRTVGGRSAVAGAKLRRAELEKKRDENEAGSCVELTIRFAKSGSSPRGIPEQRQASIPTRHGGNTPDCRGTCVRGN